jgi:methionine-rich copper-binding protein CopC
MPLSRRLFLISASAGIAVPSGARAHAALTSSHPAAGETVNRGGFIVELRFNTRIDATRSRATLSLADGSARPVSFRPGDGPAALVAEIGAVPAGACVLTYTALSVDGHLSNGTLRFTAVEG